MNQLKLQLHFLHVIKDAKSQARRALFAFADEEFIKVIVEWATITLNGNHKLTNDEYSRLKKYKNRLRALVDPKISFKNNNQLLVQKSELIVPFLLSFCRL